MALLKEAIGIDISKDSLSVCFCSIDQEQRIAIIAENAFANSPEGFEAMQQWALKHHHEGIALWYLMEATGVYYEQVAYALSDAGARFCVMLPVAVKQFSRSTSLKTKTDRVDARLLCRLALERRLDAWEPATALMRELKALVRERENLIVQRTEVRNRLHALSVSYKPSRSHRERLQEQLRFFATQIRAVEQQIMELLEDDDEFRSRIRQLETIKGVGVITIATILAETNGFALVRSVKQVISYAGLDIVHQESGMKRGRSHISKRGNSRLRRCLYMPALAAIRSDAQMRQFYDRICRGNGGQKKAAIVAVARKLLRIFYAIWRSGEAYNPARI